MDGSLGLLEQEKLSKIKHVSTYNLRQIILLLVDISLIFICFIVALNLTKYSAPIDSMMLIPIGVYIGLNTVSFTIFRCYSSLWRYAGEQEITYIFFASIAYVIPVYIINNYLGFEFSKLFYILNTLLILGSTCGFRLSYRAIRRINIKSIDKDDYKNVLIIGAGSAGGMVVNEIYDNPQIGKIAIGIIDDDINKSGRRIHNIPIIGTTKDIKYIVKRYEVDEIILCIANISNERKNTIIKICNETKCKVKTIPGIYEIINGKVDIKQIRDVDIEDLLGREPIKVNLKEMSNYLENNVVLVTGGGGSIGSELCRQIAIFNPKELVILDNYENNAYAIQQELVRKYGDKLNLKTIIASVREEKRMDEIFKTYKPNVVFHAAAHKHVPLMEKSPSEAIKNNIFGTLNVAKLSHKHNVNRFVLISTDKAVNPTNIMGATKRAAEMIIQTINKNSKTEFVAVRFGNVLGSNGSVIPLFKKQIAEGGPVTITHPDIIRYFMTIPEAVQLVIQAGAMANGGEIFVLDMGEPVKIIDLANNLIRLSGFEPGVDIKIKYSGLRPGEKLYEELLMSEEGLTKTKNDKIFIGNPINIDEDYIEKHLSLISKIVENEEIDKIYSEMKKIVDTYEVRCN